LLAQDLALELKRTKALAIPVTAVTLDEQPAACGPHLNKLEAFFVDMYKNEAFANSPVGVQVVGRRNREDELLGIGSLVDRAINGRTSNI